MATSSPSWPLNFDKAVVVGRRRTAKWGSNWISEIARPSSPWLWCLNLDSADIERSKPLAGTLKGDYSTNEIHWFNVTVGWKF
jgi:hypothetical protein